jgi:hypothetical protein
MTWRQLPRVISVALPSTASDGLETAWRRPGGPVAEHGFQLAAERPGGLCDESPRAVAGGGRSSLPLLQHYKIMVIFGSDDGFEEVGT